MQLGVSSYSFSRAVRSGAMGQLDVIAKAKEMGFDVIEFAEAGLVLPEGETALSFAPRIRDECQRVGIACVNYAVGADFLNGSGGDWRAEAERLKDEVRAAKAMGATGLRHDVTRGFPPGHVGPRGFDDVLPTLVKGCRVVTEFAADLGVRTMVENHGFFCQDSERVEKLINGVGHPNYGALIDMGNFLCVDEDPAMAVGRMAPYAFHAHAKDFHIKAGSQPDPGPGWIHTRGENYIRGAIVGHGDVPLVQCIRILNKVGYDGVLSIEFEGLEDPILGISRGLENLRRLVHMAIG